MGELNEQHAKVLKNLIPRLERRMEAALADSRRSEAEELRREVMRHRAVLAGLEANRTGQDVDQEL